MASRRADIVHILGRTTKIIFEVCAIGNETAVSGKDRVLKDRRQMVAHRQRYDRRAAVSHEGVWCDKEGTAGLIRRLSRAPMPT